MIALDRTGDKVDLLLARSVNDKVDETTLNFCPFVAHFMRQAMGVFLECLVQHTNDKKATVAPRGSLGKLLKDVNIRAVLRGGFEKLAHLVDEQDQPTMGLRIFGSCICQRHDEIALGPAAAWHPRDKSDSFDGFADNADGIIAPSDDGKDPPPLRACR